MKYSQSPILLLAFFLVLGPAVSLHSEEMLQISEFMAVNEIGYRR